MVKRLKSFPIGPQNTSALEKAISLFFEKENIFPPTQIAGYWPLSSEFDFRPLLYFLDRAGFSCSLPVVQPNTSVLQFVSWTPQTSLTLGKKRIQIPENQQQTCSPEVIFMPLLAFDTKGNRLGRGGGYFDATLRNYRTKKGIRLFALGVGFEAQECEAVPVSLEDEKIDGVLTEKGVRLFS